jgi:hypothetical protein
MTIYLLAYEDETECFETSAHKIQTPGNYPKENIQQDRQCTPKVTMTRVRVNTAVVGQQ